MHGHMNVKFKTRIKFFVPCIVIQLCNVNQQIHMFYIVLIQFLVSSTCFEHQLFIFRKTVLYTQPYMVI